MLLIAPISTGHKFRSRSRTRCLRQFLSRCRKCRNANTVIGVLKRKVLLNVKKRLTVTRVVTGASHVSVKCEKLMAGSVHCAHVQEINKLNGHTARTKANLVYEANLGLTPESKTPGGGRPPSEPGRASAKPAAHAPKQRTTVPSTCIFLGTCPLGPRLNTLPEAQARS